MTSELRTRWAAWILAAILVGSALYRPALACQKIETFGIGDCRVKVFAPARRPSGSASERSLFARANAARTSVGLPPLRWDARAARIARAHSMAMSREGKLHHNAKLRTAKGKRSLGLPRTVGENVGVGPDDRAIHRAFMDSPGHRSQILARSYRVAGFGVVVTQYEVWVTEVFVGAASSRGAPRSDSVSAARPPGHRALGAILPPPAELAASDDGADVVAARTSGAGFPWLATLPSVVVSAGLVLRRRRQRRPWA